MRYVVTGGAGFIGGHLTLELLEQGHEVIVVDNMHAGCPKRLGMVRQKIRLENADIRDFDEMCRAIGTESDIDGIFHQAALTSVPESFRKRSEYRAVNVEGTRNVFRLVQRLGAKVVYASSSSVYGDAGSGPIHEGAPKRPASPYGASKLDAEVVAEECMQEGLDAVGLRYFNVYGKGQTGSYTGVITAFMDRLGKGKAPVINGDGMQTRDFVYVGDVVEANVAAMNADVEGTYNVGTGTATTIRDLASIIIKLYGRRLEPEFTDTLPGDVVASRADTRRAAAELRWRFRTELAEGLKKMMP